MTRTRGRVLAIDGDTAVVRSELYDVRVTNAPRAWKPGDHVELESQQVIRSHGATPAPGAEVTRMPRARVDRLRARARALAKTREVFAQRGFLEVETPLLVPAPGLEIHLDAVPAESLTVVNVMSLFGLHRWLRGAAIGHFAATEITSPPGSRRMVQALQRLGAPPACVAFYAEHVEADAVHEQVVRHDVVGDLVAREPNLDRDVVFGIRAHAVVEKRLADNMLAAWRVGQSSLRRPVG